MYAPYGLEPLIFSDDVLLLVDQYTDDYPLPEEVPTRHPDIVGLTGEYGIEHVLPTWWHDMLLEVASDNNNFYSSLILRTVTPELYREGKVDYVRLKAMRASLPNHIKDKLPATPSLSAWLPSYYLKEYNDRASTGDVVLRITANPSDMFFMSSGAGWSSCQHYTGDYRDRLVSCMYDHTACFAYLIKRGDVLQSCCSERKGPILARSILRVAQVPGIQDNCVFIDRCYGQNSGMQGLLKESLCKVLGSNHLHYDHSEGCVRLSFTTPVVALPNGMDIPYQDNCSVVTNNHGNEHFYYALGGRGYYHGELN